MTHSRFPTFLAGAAVVPLAALAVAGCGGGGGGSATASGAAAPPKTASGKTAAIGVTKSGLGTILVDSHGRTIYLFRKDAGTKSACSGQCATNWPPVRAAGKPTVGRGLTASNAATTARTDGQPQVTYNGHPLYLFAGDHKPGDTNGQGLNAFGAPWYVVSPAGNQITGNTGNTQGSSGGVSGY